MALGAAACTRGDQSDERGSPPLLDYSVEAPEAGDDMAIAVWEATGEGEPADSPLHEMWTEYLGDAVADWSAPRAVIPYAPGDIPPIACGTQLDAADWADNAFYCSVDQTIVYDEVFVRSLHDRVDRSAATAIIAHEWGHHVQHVLGESGFSIQDELQADCYAGMFASRQDLDSGDFTASVGSAEAFYELGNGAYSTSRWFTSGEHGSPRQRFAAWSLGYQSLDLGFELCHGYGEWTPGQTVDIGPYTLTVVPGRGGGVDAAGSYVLEDSALPTIRVERVDISSLEQTAPAELLRSWIDRRFGDGLGGIDGPHTTERPGEVAFFYYVADPDETLGAYATHGILGIQLSTADPGHALIFDVPVSGSVPMDGDAPPELARAVENAFLVAAMIAERICAPHHTTDEGSPETHNEMCYPDL